MPTQGTVGASEVLGSRRWLCVNVTWKLRRRCQEDVPSKWVALCIHKHVLCSFPFLFFLKQKQRINLEGETGFDTSDFLIFAGDA